MGCRGAAGQREHDRTRAEEVYERALDVDSHNIGTRSGGRVGTIVELLRMAVEPRGATAVAVRGRVRPRCG